MTNEVHRQVSYFFWQDSVPFFVFRTEFPELIKLILIIVVLLVLRRLYQPSRIELQLFAKIKETPLTRLPFTIRRTFKDRSMYIAVMAVFVRWTFWNLGVGKEERYAPFETPVVYRAARPTPPEFCFNGTSIEKRRFVLAEAELCSRAWNASNGLTAVQYVPAVYSPTYHKYSCLSPSSMIGYGRITIDNGSYSGPPEAYKHDLNSLRSTCAQGGIDCRGIVSLKTSDEGNTWMLLSNGARIVIFILLSRPGRASVGEGYHAFRKGKRPEEILQTMLSVHLQLSLSNCYETGREVHVGKKSSHFYIDIRILFSLVFLECILSRTPYMTACTRDGDSPFPPASDFVVDLLKGEDWLET